MKRETILVIFLLISWSLLAEKNYKIVIIETMPVKVVLYHSEAIQKELKNLSERINISMDIEILKAEGNKEKGIELLKSYNSRKTPDIIFPIATLASQAAVEVYSGTDIPIIFSVVMDPVGAKIIDKVGVPSGKNISGVVYTHQRNIKLEMVLRVLNFKSYEEHINIGIVSSDYPSAIGDFNALKIIAENYNGINFINKQFPYKEIPRELPYMLKMFEENVNKIRSDIDYLWEAGGPLGEVDEASKILIKSGIPLILGNTERAVKNGALMSITTNYHDIGLQLIEMFEEIMEGKNIGDIPVALPRKFELHLNLNTAKKLNIKIPSHILMIAEDNIYE